MTDADDRNYVTKSRSVQFRPKFPATLRLFAYNITESDSQNRQMLSTIFYDPENVWN